MMDFNFLKPKRKHAKSQEDEYQKQQKTNFVKGLVKSGRIDPKDEEKAIDELVNLDIRVEDARSFKIRHKRDRRMPIYIRDEQMYILTSQLEAAAMSINSIYQREDYQEYKTALNECIKNAESILKDIKHITDESEFI